MGRAKVTRKVAAMKAKQINPKDARLQIKTLSKADAAPIVNRASDKETILPAPSHMFFTYNTALGPPFHVLLDTNFINFSIKNKLDVRKSLMQCLCAPAVPCITECVIAELQKLGPKYRPALKTAQDKTFDRLPCSHKGTYADDCLVHRVNTHRVFIVATCDRDLRRRLRKIPGVPIMYISKRQYTIERLPDAFMAPR